MPLPTPAEWQAQFPMPYSLRNIEAGQVDRERTIVYSMDGVRRAFENNKKPPPNMHFYIDGRKFNPNCVDQRMRLGSTEKWIFTNIPDPTTGLIIAHPAHIHVNPFQVVKRNGKPHPNAFPIWQDTIPLPLKEHQETVILQRFEDFTGNFVMHCHILGHEDRGMMQGLEVGDESGCSLCSESPDANARCKEYFNKLQKGIRP